MDNDTELTLLSLEDVFEKSATSGSNKLSGCLDVIKKHGRTALATDLALATGAFVDDAKNYESEYFLKDFFAPNIIATVSYAGEMCTVGGLYRSSIRPVLVLSNFDNYFSINDDIVEYGEYPQEAASIVMQKRLESEYKTYTLNKTGNSYTFDDTICGKETPFHSVVYDEYEYNNKKYIRVRVNSLYSRVKLSNNKKYLNGECVWIEVSPVRWLVDYKAKKLVSSKVLLSGIRTFDAKTTINHFAYTDIKEY